MTADDIDAQQRALHLAAAQASRLAALRELASDRPAHRAYLDALIAAPTDDARARVDPPDGVSATVEAALYSDVGWCLAEPPTQGYLNQYPNGYAALRRTAAARASRAAATRKEHEQAARDGRYGGLGGLLDIG